MVLAGVLASWTLGMAQPNHPFATLLHLDGAIGPASADYLERGLKESAQGGAALLIVRMDTPGGLDIAMRAMVRAILASPVPIVAYVGPSGARAASAGTFLLYASHIAAMAPGTNVGAATPVRIGAVPTPDRPQPGKDGTTRPPTSGTTMEAKETNDAAAYIRSLAQMRGRNADWAEKAVRKAASLSASEALKRGVIDVEAASVADLLKRIDGRVVLVGGRHIILATQGLAIRNIWPGWRTNLLGAITNPNIALILMMIGIYGLVFEFMSPGFLAPGTIGAICLLAGLYGFAMLPVNYAGIALILLGIGLLVAEVYTAAFGTLGVGGAVALGLGAMILVDSDAPGFRISWSVIGAVVAASLLFALVTARLALSSHRGRIVSGREEMLGMQGRVEEWREGHGYIFAHGERWQAVGPPSLSQGQAVRVAALDGLTLKVEPDPPPIEE